MAIYHKRIIDKNSNIIHPITCTDSVYDDETGESLRVILENTATMDEVNELLGYRIELTSTSDILSTDIPNTTITAKVWHGSADVTSQFNDSLFHWKRVSSDSTADRIWNLNHIGIKQITLTTLDVLYSATYSCELYNP